jgi:hypothetical protein
VRGLVALLVAAGISVGCAQFEKPAPQYKLVSRDINFRLEHLMDTPIEMRSIYVDVDWGPIKEEEAKEISDYFIRYFRTQSIDPQITSVLELKDYYTEPNEFGVVFFNNREEMITYLHQIYSERYPGLEGAPEDLSPYSGHALAHKKVAVLDGGYYDHPALYAAIMAHELVHTKGVPHTDELFPAPFSSLMDRKPFVDARYDSLGLPLSEEARAIFHSAVAGNNSHKVFERVGRSLKTFVNGILRSLE